MKAILKVNRKVIVDVIPYVTSFGKRKLNGCYRGKDRKIYFDYELELIEYYGG